MTWFNETSDMKEPTPPRLLQEDEDVWFTKFSDHITFNIIGNKKVEQFGVIKKHGNKLQQRC